MTTTQKDTAKKRAATDVLPIPSVTETLADALTDTYRLVLKSHEAHWNVTGPLFFSIHEMTEEHYSDMFAAADVLAERIRALGKTAHVDLAGLGSAPDAQKPDAAQSAEDMVRDLRSDHEALAKRMRGLVLAAEAAGDPVTADLATERAAFHEKAAWMLRATAS